jgi:hypothetical protein
VGAEEWWVGGARAWGGVALVWLYRLGVVRVLRVYGIGGCLGCMLTLFWCCLRREINAVIALSYGRGGACASPQYTACAVRLEVKSLQGVCCHVEAFK